MRIVCIGGGPAGLYFGLLMKRRHPEHTITVVERNQPYDTFGWGVVFSDAMMEAMRARRSRERGGDRRRLQPLGRHRAHLQGHAPAHHRPRLHRHRPQASAQHPAARAARRSASSSCSSATSSRDLEFPDADLIVASDGVNSQHPRALRRRVQARHRRAAEPLHLARHARSCSTPSPSISAAPSTAGSRRISTSSTRDTSTFIVETTEEAFRRRTASASSTSKARSPSARSCSPRRSTAPG